MKPRPCEVCEAAVLSAHTMAGVPLAVDAKPVEGGLFELSPPAASGEIPNALPSVRSGQRRNPAPVAVHAPPVPASKDEDDVPF